MPVFLHRERIVEIYVIFPQMSTNVSIFRVSEAVFASTPTGPTHVNVPMAGRDRTVNSVSARFYKKKPTRDFNVTVTK